MGGGEGLVPQDERQTRRQQGRWKAPDLEVHEMFIATVSIVD
jgi:hypothetical protein